MYNNKFKLSAIPDDVAEGYVVISKDLRRFCVMSYGDTIDMLAHGTSVGTSYHEVIRSHSRQKPRFDIDDHDGLMKELNVNPMKIIDLLLQAVEYVIDEYYNVRFVPETDVLLFDSSGESNGKFVYSFHIIIKNFFLISTEHSMQFFELCYKQLECIMSEELFDLVSQNRFLDSSLYKGDKRQFRMYNTYSGKRRKSYMNRFLYKGKCINTSNSFSHLEIQYEENTIAANSLVTYITRGDAMLECSIPIKKLESYTTECIEFDHKAIFSEFCKVFGKVGYISKIDKTRNMITIKRTRPSKCILCDRTHHSDNYFIICKSKLSGIVYCYRQSSEAEKKYKYITAQATAPLLREEDNEEDNEEDSEEDVSTPNVNTTPAIKKTTSNFDDFVNASIEKATQDDEKKVYKKTVDKELKKKKKIKQKVADILSRIEMQ